MYEIITILNPNVTNEFVESKISDWSDLVKEYGAELQRVDRWGKKNLAYEVKKFHQGFFLLFHIKGSHEVVDELERRFKIADEVIRFQTVKLNEKEYQNSVELLDQMNARAREEAERKAESERRRAAAEEELTEKKAAAEPVDAEASVEEEKTEAPEVTESKEAETEKSDPEDSEEDVKKETE